MKTPTRYARRPMWIRGMNVSYRKLPVLSYAKSKRCRRLLENVTLDIKRSAMEKFLATFEKNFKEYFSAWEKRPSYEDLEATGGQVEVLARDGAQCYRLSETDEAAIARGTETIFAELASRRAVNSENSKFANNVLEVDENNHAAAFKAVDSAFSSLGIYDLVEEYTNSPLRLKRVFAQINDAASTTASWGAIGDEGLPTNNPGQYIHIDSKYWPPLKVLIYVSDVAAENGPFRYVAGSHRWHDSFESVVRKTNDRIKLSAEEFLSLPEPFRKHTLLCYHLKVGTPDVDALIAQETAVTDELGNVILFDSDIIHRGGFVRSGERFILQCLFG